MPTRGEFEAAARRLEIPPPPRVPLLGPAVNVWSGLALLAVVGWLCYAGWAMADAQSANELSQSTMPGRDVVQISDFDPEVNLMTTYKAYGRKLVVETVGGGNLDITTIGVDGQHVARQLTVTAGWTEVVTVVSIQSTTDVGLLRVVF